MNTLKKILAFLFLIPLLILLSFTLQRKANVTEYVLSQKWLTHPADSILFQSVMIRPMSVPSLKELPAISVSEYDQFQSMDGFGFTLTGGSARLINQMNASNRTQLLQELFDTNSGIGISYLRISIGASDLSDSSYSYNDLSSGQTDIKLEHFSIEMERVHLIPVLKEILSINPEIKIMGSPWSAPTWMKTNNSFIGGSLRREFFDVYANYLVRFIKEMEIEGIFIDAITVQNEPLHPGNNPSMFMESADQALFIKNSLGPAFRKAALNTKIVIYDHNADRIDYPEAVLMDKEAYPFIDGTAFHLYGGQINDISKLHDDFPEKNLYFTEQWIGAPGQLQEDLTWHTENLIIGATRNWCKNVLEWNLAADKDLKPHTDMGGCTLCLGAISIDGNSITLNPAYYIIAHASKFVRPGSVRIASNMPENLPNVAFKTKTGTIVLIVLNKANMVSDFIINLGNSTILESLEAGAVASYILTPQYR
ncbi:MAG: glucosylceramidase [Bacteroidota bacterium]|nr:MAG: glucosylceramidase [Bacteroidota bacterium]